MGHNNCCVRLIKTLMSYTDEVMALISSVATQMMKGSDEYGRKSVMSMPSRSQSPYGLEAEHWNRFSVNAGDILVGTEKSGGYFRK